MSKKITGNEYTLSDIFSSKFMYTIPNYQRPYAWTKEETGTLFDDLYNFYVNEPEDNYFLGSIVLIKEENSPNAEVIDGQQRLTTLTILLAAIASKFTKTDIIATVEAYIREPGNLLEDRKPSERLHLRERDQPFFEKYIQSGHTSALTSAITNNESQEHIKENYTLLEQKLSAAFTTEDKILDFSRFLMTRCFLVSVTSPSQQSAFRVFSVMNSRGLDLLPIDIIKAEILGMLPLADQDTYTRKWEEIEMMVTRSGLNDLFGHIRMIFAKAKAKRSLLEELRSQVLSIPTNADPKAFIDNVLSPYADAYSAIKKQNYEATQHAENINTLLAWLNKINNADWVAPAVYFMANHMSDPSYLLWFFTKLETLAAYLHVCAKDINARIERYATVIKEIDDKPHSTIHMPILSIELSDVEKADFISILNGEIYTLTAIRRNYIILRLDSFVSNQAAIYDPSVLTIEHVLPQTVSQGSEWEQIWPDERERQLWLNRIANLVPLSRKHNSSAQNYDFARKKKEYFIGKNGTSSYCLTSQVLAIPDWTPARVKQRQDDLLGALKAGWSLNI